MPINIPNDLPAWDTLEQENIFIMSEKRARSQDIRPLRILILNLMPKKIDTERQLLRMLSNSPLQVDVELLQTATHLSKNTPSDHLFKFYQVFQDIRDQYFDGMIITGAPVEQMEFEQVSYWQELCTIMEWSKTHVHSTLHICWGARHTEISAEQIRSTGKLYILSTSPEAGVNIVSNHNGRQIFIFGHSEYEAGTLAEEYFRDLDKGLPIQLPCNYFPQDDPTQKPIRIWRSHAYLFYSNWLNYYVYQSTPYDLGKLRLDPLL